MATCNYTKDLIIPELMNERVRLEHILAVLRPIPSKKIAN